MYPGWPLRYFERAEQFWEITLEEKAITTRDGQIGSPGQTHRSELGAGYEAKAESRRLVAEKLKQGYVEKVPGVVTPVEHTNAALEQAILRDPYDAAAYMVYGDWLQSQGDLRGELIALATAGKTEVVRQVLAVHVDYFLGPLAAHQECHDNLRGQKRPAFTWKNGFIFGARLAHNQYADNWPGVLATDVLLPLLQHPSGKFLVELTLNENDDPTEDTLDDLFDVIAAHPIPTLRTLRIGDDVPQISWYRVGNVGAIWKALPGLVDLEIEAGEFELGTIELPHLTRAVFRTGGLSKESATSIACATWPKLEHLEVYFGDPEYGCTATIEHALAMLERTDLTELTYLGLKNAEFQADLIPQLAGSTLVRQLHTLDMACGVLLDEHVDILLAHADAFQHLEVLDVSSTWLTNKAIERLRGVAKTIKADNCWNDPDPEFRYVRVGE